LAAQYVSTKMIAIAKELAKELNLLKLQHTQERIGQYIEKPTATNEEIAVEPTSFPTSFSRLINNGHLDPLLRLSIAYNNKSSKTGTKNEECRREYVDFVLALDQATCDDTTPPSTLSYSELLSEPVSLLPYSYLAF
jgi:hypothetical protein